MATSRLAQCVHFMMLVGFFVEDVQAYMDREIIEEKVEDEVILAEQQSAITLTTWPGRSKPTPLWLLS